MLLSRRLPVLVALCVAALPGCADESDPHPTPSLVASNQTADPADRVVIDQVVSPELGWIVIHADANGTPGEVIGQSQVERGATLDVEVTLERVAIDGETLHAMLHEDGGEEGTYEFPGPDIPVTDSAGDIVVAPFTVSVPGQVLPELMVDNQLADPANEILVSAAVSIGDGWITIHADDDAQPGERIGAAAVADGATSGLVVTLDRDAADGEILHAVLRADAGTAGTLDDADVPQTDVWGQDVTVSFAVTVSAPVEVTPAVAASDQALSDPADQVLIASVTSNGPGHLVVHEDDGSGGPGDAIGSAAVSHGATENLVVALDRDAAAGETLHAMLHADGGVIGTYEPASDPPVELDGAIVVVAFQILAAAPSCQAYCDLVMAHCVGDQQQYEDGAACLAYCEGEAALPLGDAADTAGNTVGCRAYHAGVAGDTEPEVHCAHAGPTGGGVCGSWCDNYCHLALANCSGDQALFADDAACQAACADLGTDGAPGDAAGDSVQCRIYHLGVAGSPTEGGAELHCPHGAADGGGVCVDADPTCELYCATVTANCMGEDAQYDDEAACLAYCQDHAQLPPGSVDDTAANTIGCRTYHAGVAANEPAVHCPHAGPSGGDVCGSWCDNYCHLAQANCTGGDELYPDDASCQVACADFDAAGAPGATAGDSVQCRIYHLGVAGDDASGGATVHCPHGADDGGGVCVAPEPTCEEYCATITAHCAGEDAQYDSEAACLDYCQTFAQLPLGAMGDTEGNSVGCRIYHAEAAATAGTQHCVHAGPSGGDTCGDWCDNYCHLALTNCTGGDELYEDDDACQTACGALSVAGAPGATGGDSVQCRIYHLGVAGDPGGAGPGTHCPHGGEDGGGVCSEPVPEPTCAEYCTTVMAHCTGDDAQYDSEQACLDYCETFAQLPLGAVGATSGNSVGCRTYHADFAATAGSEHCAHAGPSGGGICGDWCENYCHLAQANCVGDDALYADLGACEAACAAFPVDAETGATGGDSVQCRIYHLGVAGDPGGAGPGTHCPHGGEDGGGVCVAPPPPEPTCEAYCAAVTANCAGEDAQYDSEQACLDYCQTFAALPLGGADDTSGNTVGCRTYHATVVATDGTQHCVHAGPSGGGICGDWCENYCHLAQANCVGDDALYADLGACEAACAAFPVDAETGATGGDSVQCRIYHLGVAGDPGGAGPGTHCPHGGEDGGGVCSEPPPTPTYIADVQPILSAKCSGCHTGLSSGGHNIGTTYADALGSAGVTYPACSELTVGACAILRIKNGTMPLGGGCSGDPATDEGKPACLDQAQQDTIQAWVDAGMPEE